MATESKLRCKGWKWVAVVDPFDLLTYRTIQMWPTYDLLVTHMSFLKVAKVIWHEKFLIRNNAIYFFILGRIQNWSLTQTSWRWNLWTPHASKQLEINKLVSHQWYFSAFIRPKVHSLTRYLHCFLKNMWYLGHIQII